MFQKIIASFKMFFDVIFRTDSSAVVSSFTERNGDIVPKELDRKQPVKKRTFKRSSLEHRKKISDALKGSIHSPEKRKKISKTLINYYSNTDNRKRAQDTSVNSGLTIPVIVGGIYYCSLTEASRKLNVHLRTIKNRCSSIEWTGWNFVNEDKVTYKKKKKV